jgi:hypothetical protein
MQPYPIRKQAPNSLPGGAGAYLRQPYCQDCPDGHLGVGVCFGGPIGISVLTGWGVGGVCAADCAAIKAMHKAVATNILMDFAPYSQNARQPPNYFRFELSSTRFAWQVARECRPCCRRSPSARGSRPHKARVTGFFGTATTGWRLGWLPCRMSLVGGLETFPRGLPRRDHARRGRNTFTQCPKLRFESERRQSSRSKTLSILATRNRMHA